MNYEELLASIDDKARRAARRSPAPALDFLASLSTDERGEVVSVALSEYLDDLERAIIVDRMLTGRYDDLGRVIEQAIMRYATKLCAEVLFGEDGRSCQAISDARSAKKEVGL